MIDLKKNNQFLLITLIVAAVIIISLFTAYIYTPEEDIEEEIVIEPEIPTTLLLTKTYEELKRDGWLDNIDIVDESISPLVSQGIIVEINRIRHRGLVDELLQRGLSWRNKPEFYFEATIDGKEYNSKDLYGHHDSSYEYIFNTWDTMGANHNRIQKDIPQEQETSEVTIRIVERMKTGLLGLRTNDVVQEEITLTYCYRTGRWTGDNYFGHEDGYGRHRGDTFEVQFNVYQTDFDQDGIPYWMEVNILGTDPMVNDKYQDPDNDSISTAWEWRWGYDPHSWDDHHNLDPDVDGLTNYQEYLMEKYYADPFSQDIYIEVDNMERKNWLVPENTFFEESGQVIIERFAQNNINVYIDDGWPGTPPNAGGELLPFVEVIDQDTGIMSQFYNHHFPDERKGIFRYMIVAHLGGFAIPNTFNNYDAIVIYRSPRKMMTTALSFIPRTHRIVQAAAALHEIGHTLGITPWTIEGCDNFSYLQGRQAKQQYMDTWGDYESVMNYVYIYDKNLMDYSDGSNGPPYDQNDWEYFYLPFFKIESNVIEDPFLELPGTDRMVDLDVKPASEYANGWEYDENLTKEYLSFWKSHSFVENVRCDYRVYIFTDESTLTHEDQKNVRIYAKPDVEPTYALWSLIAEATLDQDGMIICNGKMLSTSPVN